MMSCALHLAQGDSEPGGSDTCELLGLEKVNIPTFEYFNYVRREIWQPQVVINEAGKGGMRGCFTVKESSNRAATLRSSSRFHLAGRPRFVSVAG
jgi:hypothetical protein